MAENINASDILFSDLELPATLLQATQDLGFTAPTAIQAQAIPHLLSGQDVLGVAQTGTGKTAAFGIPLLAHVDPQQSHVQALVLAPTRELAMQGAHALEDFSSHVEKLEVVAVYGGSSYTPQLRALERGAQVVVGTPGRIIDLIEKKALELSHVRYFVLDEADEMLRMGFAEAVEQIAQGLPDEGRVSALFSATMPPAIRRIAEQYLHNPVEIQIAPPASTVETVHQTFAVVPERHKIGALARVLAVTQADAALVFVRTRATAEDLAIELSVRGVASSALSGDVAQKDRERLVSRLREGTLDVLVATDVAARGLDVERIGLVVNFDVPRESDTYVHRIGRTGRAGRKGEALTFVSPKERSRLRRIEKATKAKLEEVELPTPAEVSRIRAQKLIEKARERFAAGRLHIYQEVLEAFDAAQEELRVAREKAAQLETSEQETIETSPTHTAYEEESTQHVNDVHSSDTHNEHTFDNKSAHEAQDRDENTQLAPLSRDELLMALLALGVRDPGPSSEDDFVQELYSKGDNAEKKSSGKKGGRKGAKLAHAVRYRVEVGHKDRVKPGAIVGAITNVGGLRGSDLGHIDIYPTFSLVEIGVPLSAEARKRISEARVSGRALRIREDRFDSKPEAHTREFFDEGFEKPGRKAKKKLAGKKFDSSRRHDKHEKDKRDYRSERSSRFDRNRAGSFEYHAKHGKGETHARRGRDSSPHVDFSHQERSFRHH